MNRMTGFLAILAFLLIQIIACARIEFPPGGPPDTIPPQVIKTAPYNGQLDVPLDTAIVISFSEQVSRGDIRAEIFFAPQPDSFPRLTWNKNNLTISFREKLLENQTYLITLKTGLQDIHKNRLAQPYRLAFSTGDHLDSGSLAGRIYSNFAPVEGIEIRAYRTDSIISPFDSLPEYITQTTGSGEFKFEYLSLGSYLCYAIKDQAKNRRYDPSDDLLGIPPGIVGLDSLHSLCSGINFALMKRDTSALKLLSARYTPDLVLETRFSAKLAMASLHRENFSILTIRDTQAVTISDFYSLSDTTDQIMLVPILPLEKGSYLVKILQAADIQNNQIASGFDTLAFQAETLADSNPPRLVLAPSVALGQAWPAAKPLYLVFSEPIKIDSQTASIFYLISPDSLRMQDFDLKAEKNFLWITPRTGLEQGWKYDASLDLSKITDRFGQNRAGDSLYRFSFTTEDRREFGSVTGQIVLPAEGKMSSPCFLIVSLDQKISKPLDLGDSLEFRVEVPAGKYFFYGYDDRNANGNFDPGGLKPITFSEPFFVFPDTVSVRSRFEIEGLTLKIK